MVAEHLAQERQGAAHEPEIAFPIPETVKILLVLRRNLVALQKITERPADTLQAERNEFLHRFPRIRIPIAERHEHDGPRALLGHGDRIVHDLEPLEELPMLLGILDIEELLRHG